MDEFEIERAFEIIKRKTTEEKYINNIEELTAFQIGWDEAVKLFSKQIVSNTLTLADNNKDLIEVTERYGAAYHIEAVNGTTPSIDKLPLNQRVVYGDGDKYHFLLTKR